MKGKHSKECISREFQSLAERGKQVVGIDILVTSRNCDRKIMQSMRTTRKRKKKKKKEVETIRPVLKSI